MNQTKKQKWIVFGILAMLVLVLTASGIGIIAYGKVSITIIHIPIIIGTIVLGLPAGLSLSAVFGVITMLKAAGYPEGSLDSLFQNPLISILPRLMIPVIVWLVWRMVRKIADDNTLSSKVICSGFTAVFGVIANVAFVLTSMVVLYPAYLGITDSVSASATVVTNIIGINVVFEIVTAVAATCLFVPLLLKYVDGQEDLKDSPIRKTFQKWLLLFISAAFFVMLVFFYNMQTEQEQKNAKKLMYEKCQDIVLVLQHSDKIESSDLHIGEQGYVMAVKENKILFSGKENTVGKSLSDLGIELSERNPNEIYYVEAEGVSGACLYEQQGEYMVLSFMPDSEIYAERNQLAALLLGGLLCLFLLIYANISNLVQKNVVHKIQDVNNSLVQIQEGNLEEKVSVLSNTEFVELSDGINATVNALKKTMEEVAEKMNQEMEFAREIQRSALPVAGQVKPLMQEFDIYGMMDAAKEVGGDFYDFFLIGENKLGVVIADVSGKGVPAALFMMTAKTLLKNFVLNGKSPAEALEFANMQLCENNEAGMFVTVWLGVLDYEQGTLTFANAGHNPPLLKRRGEDFTYMDYKTYKRGIMLGMREGIRYKDNQIPFMRGDILYLYTDGVTEANNEKEELYGEERLMSCVTECCENSPEEMIRFIWSDIDKFAGEAEQFDDITMVVLKMNAEWKKVEAEAVYENTASLAAFVEENLPKECPPKTCHQLAIAFDEIYSNIVKYSKAKHFALKLGIMKDMIYLVFTDDGVPYNPLESETPDITAPKEEREIGGLGLFMVKKTMDYIDYQYVDNQNRFMIGKKQN